jgi:hypothetical protein
MMVSGQLNALAALKQSICKPGEALRVSGGSGSQISRQYAREGCKVIGRRTGRLHPQEIFLV